ncbi:molecular chaperone MKKS-like [Physella acuta]|uniref:molecular chaperone MKKS-like n=1 Tax=Physella acuta TaxID=109671 RepID=UPI0027DBB1A0|nr:molecular chaperone MKKS-like [Physella acuta]XP_059162982.1 molecular chaperone MKKS-like [Physella acuta]XP_059162989.1 molecular chaperone MKKS-like [Physella acuta]XP_059162997.1 molecular chaperone MKKS-like [Physella acuta]XP_059163002.1 molecular chaperone MKKS-like [Physella acuta]XP_059163006.1 molecular chaperone MKKS-like [Physella acuta]XP_059163014.1 molecular chaperone MKKS-like [Physella acuta]XP_059163024.1 molecular chaperone MKKS-like [Physella acuta]XP_059163032.1 mole
MSRLEQSKSSDVVAYNAGSPTSLKSFSDFLKLLSSCVGPGGKIHMLRNKCGGSVTFTSSSGRILSGMSLSRPELKLVETAVQAHVKQHGDCGLFMAYMCLHLVYTSNSLHFNRHSLVNLFELFVKDILDYLNGAGCQLCVKADFSDLKVLLAYVRSIITSKALLRSADHVSDTLSQLILQAFVESIPDLPDENKVRFSDGINVLCFENRHLKESRLEKGLLLEYPEFSALHGVKEVKLKTVSLGIEGDFVIQVALFICSLSGDAEEVTDATFEIYSNAVEKVDKSVVLKIAEMVNRLENLNVGLVLCQKVIHPNLKGILKAKDIMYVERIGSQMIPYLQDLTGAKQICSVVLTQDLSDKLGWVRSVDHVVESSKSYLRLSKPSSPVVTLIMCDLWESRLSEMKVCIKTVFHGLHSLCKEPKLLPGGGCWQTHCSYFLRGQVLGKMDHLVKERHYSESQVLSALQTFRSSFHHWATSLGGGSLNVVVDPTSFHCWRLDNSKLAFCCCGMKSSPRECLETFDFIYPFEQPSSVASHTRSTVSVVDNPAHPHLVLDSFVAATQALQKGIFSANLLLSLGQFVVNKN